MTVVDQRAPARRWPPLGVDCGIAVALALAMVLTITVAAEEGAREPDAPAYLLGLAIAGLVFVRRRWPMGALVGSVGCLMVYLGLNYPGFSLAVPLATAAYSAATAGSILAASALLAGIVLFGIGWQTMGENSALFSVLGTQTLADVALLAAVLLLGEAVRGRRAWTEEVRARLRRDGEDHERAARARVREERLRIARELHDVMGHTIAALNVHAAVAAEAIDDDPGQAKASLRTIREQSREAMHEVEASIGLLRSATEPAPRSPVPGLGGLDGLVRTATSAGIDVDVDVVGAARSLPAAIDLTAYRIVQESLTNVVQHAHASTATLQLAYEHDAITIQISDDGHSTPNGVGGHGLLGMRERALAVGGTLEAGLTPAGGFRVSARLPTTADAAQ